MHVLPQHVQLLLRSSSMLMGYCLCVTPCITPLVAVTIPEHCQAALIEPQFYQICVNGTKLY